MQVQGVMLVLLMLATGLSVKLPDTQRRGRHGPVRTHHTALPTVSGKRPLFFAAVLVDGLLLQAVPALAGLRRHFPAFFRAPFVLQPA